MYAKIILILITIKPHKVQNVVIVQQMVKGTVHVSGCTVCMHSLLLWWSGGFFSELKDTKSKCTEGKKWAEAVMEWRGVG